MTEPPLAREGVLDLRQWDFDKNGPINLYGEWHFYWKMLLPVAYTTKQELPPATGYLSMPSHWNDFVVDGQPIGGQGFASFFLTVWLPPQATELAFKIKDVQTAYRLIVNGEQIALNGTVGVDSESSVPDYVPLVAPLHTNQSELRILLQVSNFDHRMGGVWESIKLGNEESIHKLRENRLILEIFVIGSILIMGLYHLALFFHRKKDKSSLYFGGFCLVITIRSLMTGERYVASLIPSLSWSVSHKLEYISFYIGLTLFAMFLYTVFPREFSKKVLVALQIFGSFFSLVVIVTPAVVYTHTVNVFQGITIASGTYAIYILLLAIIRKREGSWIILCGFLLLFVAVINDILHVNQIIHTGFYISFGLFVFIFSQASLIALRFSQSFQIVEQQAWELIKTNDAFRNEIKERKKLEKNLVESHEQFQKSRMGTILGLAKLAEYRDEDTGTHLERMREYCKILAIELATHRKYKDYITEAYINDLFHSSILHDIGKVGIPDSVLLKPGKLTDEEFKIIQQHSIIGGDAIANIESRINMQSFLTLGREIAYGHHEKWDGSGYPQGLKGTEIPLSARIVALADVYDALTSERPYKKPFSHEKAKAIILEGEESHFDPLVISAFLTRESEFKAIYRQFQTTSSGISLVKAL